MSDLNTHYSITIDKRRPKQIRAISKTKAEGLYPVRLRVYNAIIKKDKRYPLDVELWERDFTKIFHPKEGERLNKEQREIKLKLSEYENKAKDVINSIDVFTFELFEKKYFRTRKEPQSVSYHYQEKITQLNKDGKVSTAESYRLSLKSIESYIKSKGKNPKALRLAEIDQKWLKNYELYMIREGKSKTTIGIYLRPLQHIFNTAITAQDIAPEYYPFGKKGYKIPKGNKVKKALTADQLKTLFYASTQIPQQEKAKDFWLLSYLLHGMNLQDIALLKFSDLHDDRIEFIREKTKDTTSETKLITTFLNDHSRELINKYKRRKTNQTDFVFEIIEMGMTPEQIKRNVKVFTRFINQHMKTLAKLHDLPEEISFYWARHTFATTAVNKGASMEFISEALGHSDLKTTQIYFAGFEKDSKKAFSQSLIDF